MKTQTITKPIEKLTKEQLIKLVEEKQETIKEQQETIKTQKDYLLDYAQAIETSRNHLKQANEQIKKQANYFIELQEVKEKLQDKKEVQKREPIIEFLLKNYKNSFNLSNYFKELFIQQQFCYSKKSVNITKLELSLLTSILWKYKNNKSDIVIMNTDFTLNDKGLYKITFNVDSSLMKNDEIAIYNKKFEHLGINIPLNSLTEEEKEMLQAQDREVLVIER